MFTKSLWESKTFWLGVLQMLAAIVEYLAGVPANLTLIQLISGIMTIIVRFFTNTALSGTPGSKK